MKDDVLVVRVAGWRACCCISWGWESAMWDHALTHHTSTTTSWGGQVGALRRTGANWRWAPDGDGPVPVSERTGAPADVLAVNAPTRRRDATFNPAKIWYACATIEYAQISFCLFFSVFPKIMYLPGCGPHVETLAWIWICFFQNAGNELYPGSGNTSLFLQPRRERREEYRS